MPREKLITKGVDTLSMAELLAIIFGTGSRKENVIELTSRLVRDYSDSAIFAFKRPKIVSERFKLPLVKACQVVAVSEIGRRLFLSSPRGAPLVRRAKDAFEHLTALRNLPKEQAICLYLNTRGRVVYQEVIGVGTLSEIYIHPREVFAPAVELRSSRVIFAHNHPSGTLTPSRDDDRITARLLKSGKLLGIPLVDHIIVTSNSFFSYAENKRLTNLL